MMIKKLIFHSGKIKYFSINRFQRLINSKINVLSKEESLEFFIQNKISISRFGDGEIRLVNGEDIEFQKSSYELSQRLKEVLTSDFGGYAICVSGVFNSLKLYTKAESYFWNKHLSSYRKIWMNYLKPSKTYLNTFITRPYIGYKDKTDCEAYFSRIKTVWDKKKVLIVEGEQTRFGISNALLDNAHSIHRILGPSVNAFSKYVELLENSIKFCNKAKDETVVLIALGPTATVMAYDLAKIGIQGIDIGHLDIEYEWFLMGATSKVRVKGKYTNEAVYDKSQIENCVDTVYKNQIVKQIY
jgi:glycosyltransferase family protein